MSLLLSSWRAADERHRCAILREDDVFGVTNLDSVEALLEANADPNLVNEVNGWFPLLSASFQGNNLVVKALLDANAEPHQVNKMTGDFPLLLASMNGHANCMALLMEAGASFTQTQSTEATKEKKRCRGPEDAGNEDANHAAVFP
eukprot:TRINITY_DN35097_c0_g1_i2.p1 TRINITY_DN35097_c0_g1~~TRINITY_DN35097_c0_g1_i2.p1  ORF type:complete len:146 (+),score=37.34 TRINITY_DN35097_c0_g1_i2:128-565(+)